MRIRQRFLNFPILGHDFCWLFFDLSGKKPTRRSPYLSTKTFLEKSCYMYNQNIWEKCISAYFPNLTGIIADMTPVTCYHVSASSGLGREINAASDPISAFVFRCQMKISGRWVADLWYLLQALYLFSGGISVSQYLLLRGPLLSWAMLPNISIHRPILCYVLSASRLEPGP